MLKLRPTEHTPCRCRSRNSWRAPSDQPACTASSAVETHRTLSTSVTQSQSVTSLLVAGRHRTHNMIMWPIATDGAQRGVAVYLLVTTVSDAVQNG